MDTEEMTFPRPDGHEQILLYPVYESLIYIYIYNSNINMYNNDKII